MECGQAQGLPVFISLNLFKLPLLVLRSAQCSGRPETPTELEAVSEPVLHFSCRRSR